MTLEDHYRLRNTMQLDRVEDATPRPVIAPGGEAWGAHRWEWGHRGTRTTHTAVALLVDAAPEEMQREGDREPLAVAFAEEVLALGPADGPMTIAVREVRGWLTDRRAHVLEPASDLLAAGRDPGSGSTEMAGWLAAYRAVHGPIAER